jgi:hypothetical protein
MQEKEICYTTSHSNHTVSLYHPQNLRVRQKLLTILQII